MTYKETTEWMFAQLPMFQNVGASAYKKDLTNTLLFLEHLGNPHLDLKCLHIAGTNGKGSTSSMLSSILQEAGFKVGLYTSPHLKDYRERIKINGNEIEENFVIKFIDKYQSFLEKHQLSFFEMTVCLAFEYFFKQKIDFAIIEVGMGGRLDSTNVITPIVSIITNIGWDHTQFLGDTLAKIATEKAGIIKKDIPVIIGTTIPETKEVFSNIANDKNAPIYFATQYNQTVFASDLKGNYQKENIKTVLQTIKILNENCGFEITEEQIKKGLLNVVKNTHLQGRWQQLQNNPMVICDTAHNYDGLLQTMQQIKEHQYQKLHLVLGFVNDKDLYKIIPLFPKDAIYYLSKPNVSRGLDEKKAQLKFAEFGIKTQTFPSVETAYQSALQFASKDDFIYIGGSTFVVAEVL